MAQDTLTWPAQRATKTLCELLIVHDLTEAVDSVHSTAVPGDLVRTEIVVLRAEHLADVMHFLVCFCPDLLDLWYSTETGRDIIGMHRRRP